MIDPLTGKLGSEMPVASQHYQVFPMAVLTAGYMASAITLIGYLIVAIVRRADDDGMPRVLAAGGAGGAGVLVVAASALGLPAIILAVVGCLASGAIWYGGSRRAVPPEDDDYDEPTPAPLPPRGRRARHGSSPLEEMRRGEAAARVGPPTEPSAQVGDGSSGGPPVPYRGAHGGDPYATRGERPRAALPRGEDPYADRPRGDQQPGDRPANGVRPAEGLGWPVASGLHRAGGGAPEIGPSPHLYGFISIFTLSEGQGERFDRLTSETLAQVREAEPDTLIYVAHTVPNAPLQRIFYEVYRNRDAYEEHGRQPHVQRFRAERGACVVATNVIELKLASAKISPAGPLFGDPTRR